MPQERPSSLQRLYGSQGRGGSSLERLYRGQEPAEGPTAPTTPPEEPETRSPAPGVPPTPRPGRAVLGPMGSILARRPEESPESRPGAADRGREFARRQAAAAPSTEEPEPRRPAGADRRRRASDVIARARAPVADLDPEQRELLAASVQASTLRRDVREDLQQPLPGEAAEEETATPTGADRRRQAGELLRRTREGPIGRSDLVAAQMARLAEDPAYQERFGQEFAGRTREAAEKTGDTEATVRDAAHELLARPVAGSLAQAGAHMTSSVMRGLSRAAERSPTTDHLAELGLDVEAPDAEGVVAQRLRGGAGEIEDLVEEAQPERVKRTAEALGVSPEWAERIATVGDMLSSGVVTSAAIMGTGPLGIPTMFMMGLGEIDQEAEEKGLSDEERSFLMEAGAATLYAQIERLGELPASPIVKRLLGRWERLLPRGLEDDIRQGLPIHRIMAKFGLTEMVEEAAQDATNMAVVAGQGEGRQYTPEEVFQRLAISAVGGLVGSLPMSAVAGLAARARPKELATEDSAGEEGGETPSLRRRFADMIDPSRAEELEQAFQDPMTGLPNQSAFERTRARLDDDPAYHVASFDVTNLKAINDILGREAGDQRIEEVAAVIQEEAQARGLEPRDVQRAGGDEFAIWGADPEVLQEVIDAAKERLQPLQAGEFTSHIRGAVGPKWLEAEGATQAEKEGEEGPRARNVKGGEEAAPVGVPATEPAPEGAPTVAARGAFHVNPSEDLDVEPKRFQYKDVPDMKAGVGSELRGVQTWDENFAGVVLVWRDPKDGRLKVINGHHRVDLARRLGVGEVLVRQIQAESAEEARSIGAMTNIAEGRGTPVDAAKVFRDAGRAREDIEGLGIPMTGEVAKEGLALSNLHEGLFSLAARGKVPWRRLAVIGRSRLEPDQQLAVWELVKKEEEKGKRLTNDQVEELARFVRTAESEQVNQETLFGAETVDHSLAVEKARLSAWVKEKLRSQARTFKFLAKSERAGQIEEAGVGTIDIEKAGSIGTEASQVAEVYDRLSASAGPVSDALNQALREIRAGAKENDVRAGLLDQVKLAVQEVLGGAGSEDGGRGEAPPGPAVAVRETAPAYGREAGSQDREVGRDPFPARPGAFFSRLERAIEQAPQASMPAEQWLGYLNPAKRGFSASEAEWVELEPRLRALGSLGDPVTKDELLGMAQGAGVRLEETVLGGEDPRVRALEEESAELQPRNAAARRAFIEAMERAGYTADEIRNNAATAHGRVMAPAGAELEAERRAWLDARNAIGLEGALGFDSIREAMATLADERDISNWDMKQSTAAAVLRWKGLRETRLAAQIRAEPEEVADAHRAWTALSDEWNRLRREIRKAKAETSARYADYTEPGGENYREILIRLDGPRAEVTPADAKAYLRRAGWDPEEDFGYTNERDYLVAAQRRGMDLGGFRTPHFDEHGILVHARVNDRTGPNGEKVLFVEEIQSDWAQQGRREGFRQEGLSEADVEVRETSDGDWIVDNRHTGDSIGIYSGTREEAIAEALEDMQLGDDGGTGAFNHGVPDMPFKGTSEWVELAMKRVIDEAVKGGYDRVAFISGEKAAERYDLSRQVDSVHWTDWPAQGPDTGILSADRDGERLIQKTMKRDGLPDHVGKEVAERLLAQEPNAAGGMRSLSGVDLKVGGQGMIDFYDKIIPRTLSKYLPKVGGPRRLEPIELAGASGAPEYADIGDVIEAADSPEGATTPPFTVLSFPITPEMAETVRTEGQRLMERGPGYGRATRSQGIPRDVPHINTGRYRKVGLPLHPDFKAAKAGDVEAAVRVVRDVVKPHTVARARKEFGPDVVYLPVVGEEQTGRNKIPTMVAERYAAETGARTTADVVQANRAFHRGASKMERLLARPIFNGPIEAGARYVLVDDVTTSGATIAELAEHVRKGGGEVAGVVTIASGSPSGKLSPDERAVQQIDGRLGDVIREEVGIEPSALTADEVRYLQGFRTPELLRDRIASARVQRSERLREAGVLPDEGPEGVGEVREGPDTDLFGEPIAPTGPAQRELLPQRGAAPQGMSEALDNARAVVSALRGRVNRGAATDYDRRRYEEARSLLRRSEGRGLDEAEVQARRQEGPAPDDLTVDLFGDMVRERMEAGDYRGAADAAEVQADLDVIEDRLKEADIRKGDRIRAQERIRERRRELVEQQLEMTFGSKAEAQKAVRAIATEAGDLLQVSIPGVPTTPERIAAVEKGREAGFGFVNAAGHILATENGRVRRDAVYRMLRAFRHPAAEYFHLFVTVPTEDGSARVHTHRMSTTGALDMALVYRADWAEMAALAKRLGGQVWMAHNHPSGDPNPSPEDRAVTRDAMRVIERVGAEFGGHMVINGEDAVLIGPGTWGDLDDQPIHLPRPRGERDWTTLGEYRRVGGAHDIFRLLQDAPRNRDRVDVVLLDTRHSVVALESRHVAELEDIAEWLPGLARDAAAANAILGTTHEGTYLEVLDATKGLPLPILDVVEIEKGLSAVEERADGWSTGNVSMLEREEPYGRERSEEAAGGAAASGDRPGRSGEPTRVRERRPAGGDREGVPDTESSLDRIAAEFRRLTAPDAQPEGRAGSIRGEGAFEALPATTPDTTLRPISPVELTRLAVELLEGNKVFLKKYPSARGMFYGDPANPRIGLNPLLGQDYEQFAKALAHEVGHLIDFLPDQDLRRGNILGRLATLRGYLTQTIDATPSDPSRALTPTDRRELRKAAEKKVGSRPAKDAEADLAAWREAVSYEYAELVREEIEARNLLTRERIHEELMLLSEFWRGPIEGSPSFVAYRSSSVELYADALSALLTSPGTLQEKAPAFFDAFLSYMERKPKVKEVYEGIQETVGAGEDAIYEARREELHQDFERGEEIRREAEREPGRQVLRYLQQTFLSRSVPVTKAEKKRLAAGKSRGQRLPAHSSQNALRHALQEYNHGDNANRLMLMDIAERVHVPMLQANIDPKDAGEYLMLRRIADGDRGGMAEQAKEAIQELTGQDTWEKAEAAYLALDPESQEFDADLLALARSGLLNPHGYTPAEARRTLEGLQRRLGAEKFAAMETLMGDLRSILWRGVEEAVRVGSYNSRVFEERILPNRDTYAPFAVLDYFNGRMPAGVKGQMGTVKSVANPYTTSILKAMALNRLNEAQKAKLAVLGVLDIDFPGMAGEVRRIDKYNREQHPGPDRENLLYLVDGKLHYREVDAYIAKVLLQSDMGALEGVVKTLSSKSYGIFHPLYVSWSLAWQVRNIQRDWKRTYKNLAASHAGKPTYRQAIEAVLDIGRTAKFYGKTAGAAWRHARRQRDPLVKEMLRDRALGRAFHSFEPDIDAQTHERLLQRYGIQEPETRGLKKAARTVGSPIETMGVFQETWAKAAIFKLLGERGITGRERAYIVRNYSGTPDSTDRGLASDGVNAIYMYANVMMAGIRSDLEVATQPSTAAGYWLRSVLIDFGPKLLMAAGVWGWLGDELEEWFERIPSYDMEKYLILPVPPFWSTNELGERKAVYLRLPHDDANRILAGTVWALIDQQRPHAISRAVGLLKGEFPGLTPALDLPLKWAAAAANVNPRDEFRGREVVPRTQWEAGGWHRWKEMIRYTLGEFGILSQLGGHWLYASPEEGRSAPGEEFLRSIPGLSSLVKVTDRGMNEQRYWEIDWETRERARLRSDLPHAVRRATSERNRLNRLGEERLSPQEQRRRLQLNDWYREHYLPGTALMERARDNEDDETYRSMATALGGSVPGATEAAPLPSRDRPRRPSRPSRPSRSNR